MHNWFRQKFFNSGNWFNESENFLVRYQLPVVHARYYFFLSKVTPPLDVETLSETLKEKNILPSTLKFGFLGLGIMGSGIVKNLINSGHSVIVWNRTQEKVRRNKRRARPSVYRQLTQTNFALKKEYRKSACRNRSKVHRRCTSRKTINLSRRPDYVSFIVPR